MEDVPIPVELPPLIYGDTPDENLKMAADYAAINLLTVQQEIALRLLQPNMTSKMLLDFGEHSFKVSGAQKKQEVKDAAPAFVLNINLGDKTLHIAPERSVDGEVVDDPSPMDLVREAASQGLLKADIFEDAPEFR